MSRTDGRTRKGFTLIELLVVVTIIGILASLLVVAVYRAVVSATAAARKAEVKGMESAIELMVIADGQGRNYPPDFTDVSRVRAYLIKRFGRINPGELNTVAGLNLTPAQSLVFWLMGTSDDPAYPFTGPGGPLNANPAPRYEFDPARLKPEPLNPGSPIRVYCPSGSGVPFVYFAARPGANPQYAGSYNLTSPPAASGLTNSGVAIPYQRDPVNNVAQGFCNPMSFQIISAGVDSDYGSAANRFFPSGTGYTKADDDNVVNFNEFSTLGADKP